MAWTSQHLLRGRERSLSVWRCSQGAVRKARFLCISSSEGWLETGLVGSGGNDGAHPHWVGGGGHETVEGTAAALHPYGHQNPVPTHSEMASLWLRQNKPFSTQRYAQTFFFHPHRGRKTAWYFEDRRESDRRPRNTPQGPDQVVLYSDVPWKQHLRPEHTVRLTSGKQARNPPEAEAGGGWGGGWGAGVLDRHPRGKVPLGIICSWRWEEANLGWSVLKCQRNHSACSMDTSLFNPNKSVFIIYCNVTKCPPNTAAWNQQTLVISQFLWPRNLCVVCVRVLWPRVSQWWHWLGLQRLRPWMGMVCTKLTAGAVSRPWGPLRLLDEDISSLPLIGQLSTWQGLPSESKHRGEPHIGRQCEQDRSHRYFVTVLGSELYTIP